jgi:hypothetical protein
MTGGLASETPCPVRRVLEIRKQAYAFRMDLASDYFNFSLSLALAASNRSQVK